MTPERAQVLIAAITSTLYEVGGEQPVPASSIYLVLGCDIEEYQMIAKILEQVQLAIVTQETIRLTPLGMKIGKQCQELLESKEAK
jgi:hypothetical protein